MTRDKVNRITFWLLLLGLGSALVIFLTAHTEPVDPMLGDPLTNKKYLRELRVLGGEANVLAAEFQEWFAGLWHGVALARTVTVLTVGATFIFRFVAMHPDNAEPDEGEPPAAPPEK